MVSELGGYSCSSTINNSEVVKVELESFLFYFIFLNAFSLFSLLFFLFGFWFLGLGFSFFYCWFLVPCFFYVCLFLFFGLILA